LCHSNRFLLSKFNKNPNHKNNCKYTHAADFSWPPTCKHPLHLLAAGEELADGADDVQPVLNVRQAVRKAELEHEAGEAVVEAGDCGQVPKELVRFVYVRQKLFLSY
jgi:hypothetical protein